MPCASSTSSFRLRIRDPPVVQATPVDERDWLPSCVVNGFDDDELCRLAPTLPRTPTVIPKPTWILQFPPLMIPLRTSSIDLASHHHKRTSKSDTRNSQLQLRDARRHARLEPTHGLHLLPNPRILLFRWAPTPSHSNLRYPPHSRVLAPLRPLHVYT
ncbi:hypothetical protein BGW80DRAFT_1567994 [Lactifluus volemus]|nr:hypothetical protein BGW80DRAFT_1567994 [Lactifluus volemus]